MASDRFIYFAEGKVPSHQDVGMMLEDYLGAVMAGIEWGGSSWTALLVGNKSWPFRRVYERGPAFNKPLYPGLQAILDEERDGRAHEERRVEVYIGDDNIDVITRRQDELTNRIADGFARLVARFWQGSLEMETLA